MDRIKIEPAQYLLRSIALTAQTTCHLCSQLVELDDNDPALEKKLHDTIHALTDLAADLNSA